MEKRIKICDRCGKEIKYEGWTGFLTKRSYNIFLRKIYNGNPDGYSYLDWEHELCKDCVKSFDKWFEAGMSNK